MTAGGRRAPAVRRADGAIVVVGPCAAGKTTLVWHLARAGVLARTIAQEHSVVPTLFSRYPGAGLIYLTADWAVLRRRRPHSGGWAQYAEEMRVLQTARAAAELVVHTDSRTPEAVAALVLSWWRHHGQAEADPRV